MSLFLVRFFYHVYICGNAAPHLRIYRQLLINVMYILLWYINFVENVNKKCRHRRKRWNKYLRAYWSLRLCDIPCQKCPGNLVLPILEYTWISWNCISLLLYEPCYTNVAFLSSQRHNSPSKLRLRNNHLYGTSSSNRLHVDVTIYSNSARSIFTSPTVDSCQSCEMATLLNSLSFVFKISFLPNYRVIYCFIIL